MEKFPIDCFEFFPCAHKLCQFCYHNIKQLKCPYCRLDLEPPSDVDDPDYNPDYYTIPELPTTFMTNRNRRRNRKRNRRNAQRNSNNELMLGEFYESNSINTSNASASDTSLESNSSNSSNESNVSSRRNRNNLRNTTERFTISAISTMSTRSTTITSLNDNHFSLLAD